MRTDRQQHHAQLGAEHELRIRLAVGHDSAALARLAAVDSQARLDGDALIAELDGTVVAALALQDGRLIADPFAPTAAVGDHLRLRVASIQPPPRRFRTLRGLLGLSPSPSPAGLARPKPTRSLLPDRKASR